MLDKLALVVETVFREMTYEALVTLLRQEDHQGFVSSPTGCPLAKLVSDRLQDYVGFNVDSEGGLFFLPLTPTPVVGAPHICADFAKRFDKGEYPELVAWKK